MTADDVVITVDHVGKTFRLPHEKQSSVKGALISVLRGGRRSYEKQQVLKNVSFKIKRGEFFGIIGRNGSGKSTLLKMLAGIYVPSEGNIEVRGKLTPFIELGVGFNPELTGRENVFLNGALLGFNRSEMEVMYDDIVEFAEIHRFMDQKLKNYSSGMQVRLAFSIAIRAKTDILLLDEVLAVGDQNFQDKCFNYFEQIKKTDMTVIFISHDSGAIERFCTRAAIIDKGDLVDIGEPRKMVLKYGKIMANEQQDIVSPSPVREDSDGTGQITIGKTQLIDEEGKITNSIIFGEKFTLRLHFMSHDKTAHKTVIGVDIIDSSGLSILGPNTGEALKEPVVIQDNGYVDVAFSTNVLAPGQYSVTVGIFNDKSTFAYDLVEHGLKFKVIGSPRHGKIYIEPQWLVTQDSNHPKPQEENQT